LSGPAPRPALEVGALAVLAAAALWGCIGVLSVGLFRLGVGPWEVAFWRAALSAPLLLAYLLLFHRSALRLGSARDLALLAAFGSVGVGLFYVAFQLATYLTSVAVAVVLLYTAPALVVLGAHALLGERLDRWKGAMVATVVLGVWATALGAAGAEVRLTVAGVGWGLAAALSYSAYYLFGKRYLPRFGVLRTLFYSLLVGALLLGPAAALAGQPPRLAHPPTAWILLLGLSLGTTLLANGLYYWGLARVEAGRAAVIASVEPVVAAFLALALFGQSLTPVGWLGVGLVVLAVAGVPALQRRARRRPGRRRA
jgi:drug/metabolite transporter, DME family